MLFDDFSLARKEISTKEGIKIKDEITNVFP